MNNGLNEKTRKDVASGLSTILADTYTLNLKTLNFPISKRIRNNKVKNF